MKIIEESSLKSSVKTGANITEIIQGIYDTEKLTELDTRLRYFFCVLLKDSISGLFPYCEVIPFGSSVNGIGSHGCDLDVCLWLDSKQVNEKNELIFRNRTFTGNYKHCQKRMVVFLFELFQTFPSVSNVQRVLEARVPIAKLYHRGLKLQCDISINNFSPVYMSEIIHFCGEIDERFRPLVFNLKKWAKEAKVTDLKASSGISNFGLTNLVIFFLQNRPNPILPPLNNAFTITGEENSPEFGLKYLKSVEEWKKYSALNKESLAELLKEFFLFLASENFQDCVISLMSGKKRKKSCDDQIPLHIQYPFDESLNVTKHVSFFEFDCMQEKARTSALCLENHLKQNENNPQDFDALLDIATASSTEAVHSSLTVDKSNLIKLGTS